MMEMKWKLKSNLSRVILQNNMQQKTINSNVSTRCDNKSYKKSLKKSAKFPPCLQILIQILSLERSYISCKLSF